MEICIKPYNNIVYWVSGTSDEGKDDHKFNPVFLLSPMVQHHSFSIAGNSIEHNYYK